MSGGISVVGAISAAAAVAGVVMQSQAASKAAKQQDSAQKQAQVNADKAAREADQASNKANQKSPDTAAILSAAEQAGKGGASGTMLTGAQGIDPNALALGKSTLLGA